VAFSGGISWTLVRTVGARATILDSNSLNVNSQSMAVEFFLFLIVW